MLDTKLLNWKVQAQAPTSARTPKSGRGKKSLCVNREVHRRFDRGFEEVRTTDSRERPTANLNLSVPIYRISEFQV